MMEHDILGPRSPEGHIARSGEEWRALSWQELVARLSAARDLRRVLAGALPVLPGALPGSFAPVPARRLAAMQDGNHAVNPNDLGNRKACGATIVGIVDERSPASRGKE
jgi:hypothetical protein